jgi:uncharacterized protein YggT (Ycf19 family)
MVDEAPLVVVMEEYRMRNNPYPDEPTSAQPTEMMPPMEDLLRRPKPAQAPPGPAPDPTTENDTVIEIRQEEARTLRYAIGKLSDFLQWFIVVLEVTLGIRFFLKLIGADPANPFAGMLYALTGIMLFPFSTILPPSPPLEWSTLIAMVIYWLVFWATRRFLFILITGPEEVAS